MHPHPPCWCPDVEKQSKQKVNHKGAVSVMQQRLSRYCGHRERTPEQHFCLGTQIAYSQHSWVHSQCFSAGKSNYDTGPKTPYFFIKELLVWSFLYSDAFGNQDQFNIIQHYFGPYFTVTPWKKRKKKMLPTWSRVTTELIRAHFLLCMQIHPNITETKGCDIFCAKKEISSCSGSNK